MTEQMFVFLCRDVRKFAFDYRRGEMQPVEQRKLEEHVQSCEACQDYLNKLEGMLDAAAIHDYTPPTDRDDLFEKIVAEARSEEPERLNRDALFDRITAEIDQPELRPKVATEALQIAEPAPTTETDRDEERPRRPIALYVVAALAAGILIGISLSFLYPLEPTTSVAPAPIAKTVPQDQPAPTAVRTVVALDTLTLQPTPAEFDDVRVFGEAEASWQIRTQGKRRKLTLDEGTVLVEFVPKKDRELEFVSDDFTVRITGTLFYVSAEKGIVGVVTGSVEVEPKDGDTIRVGDGEEWVMGEGLRAAPDVVRPQAERHVTVQDHRRALELARAETDQRETPPDRVEAPRPPMTPEVKETPRARLRASADAALREGRYEVAAQYYERMVDELSAADPANASLRLDLARLYIRHLGQQRRALVHLRRFVADRPDDSLTPAARVELCRIATEVDADEPECRP